MERPAKRVLTLKKTKVTKASDEEKELYGKPVSQSGDILSLTRSATAPPTAAVPASASASAPAPAPSALLPLPLSRRNPMTQKSSVLSPFVIEKVSKYPVVLKKYANNIVSEESVGAYSDKREKLIFPMQTRLGFQNQIRITYQEFITIPTTDAIDYDACKKMGSGSQTVEMYEYQKFIREYVRNASPYRGVLVYHGLGSGKTCSAIAAAESLFSHSKKKIIVMTPFSLRDNFIREVTFCGFRHYRLQNHWVSMNLDMSVKLFATEILGLSEKYLKGKTRIWIPDFEKEVNINSLPQNDKSEIQTQLVQQITSRITFINYNGISAAKLKEIACAPRDASGNSLFDNAVIVIDEIHNLTRLMQGTIEPYLTNLSGSAKRKIPVEPVTPGNWEPSLCKKLIDKSRPYLTNYKRGYTLYRLLSGARNSKLIGLSGTPLINFPEEIAILTNLLAGYINTCSFIVNSSLEKNKRDIEIILKENKYVDFVEVELLGLTTKVYFSLLNEGLEKAVDERGVLGVQKVGLDEMTPDIFDVSKDVIEQIGIKIPGVQIGNPEFKSEALLPPVGEEFRESFLSEDGSTVKKERELVLQKRLQGVISYYKGSKKELMPLVTKDELVRVPFSQYAQTAYQQVRADEINQAEKTKKKTKEIPGVGGKMANLWAELYGLSKMKASNSYRMASRQTCNFAFPEGIARPRPTNQKDAFEEVGDKDIIDAVNDSEMPMENEFEIPSDPAFDTFDALDGNPDDAQQEDLEIDNSERRENIVEAREKGDLETAEELEEEEEEEFLINQKAAPSGITLPSTIVKPETTKKTLDPILQQKAARALLAEQCKAGYIPGEQYLLSTKRAKKCLKAFKSKELRLYASPKVLMEEINRGNPPDADKLYKYSPKFATILQKILESRGSNLVYSQFLDMEGIGIFLIILDINDFYPIEFQADSTGNIQFTSSTIAHLKKGPSVNRYLSFTGKENRTIRNAALRVFNAKYSAENNKFTELSSEMSDILVNAGFTGNLKGELCRVFCITSAGAEGLSLKNVRRVHIMEPYWNHVRTDQVKGRAVRICSHVDLEYNDDPSLNQRTVEVYTYCSIFHPDVQKNPAGSEKFPRIDQTIIGKDTLQAVDAKQLGYILEEGMRDYTVTSDEYLYTLSETKKRLLQNIQTLMKEAAVDCQINQYENQDENIRCINLAGSPEQYAFHPILKKDIANTSTQFKKFAPPLAPSSSSSSKAVATIGSIRPKEPVTKKIPSYPIRWAGVDYIAFASLEKGQQIPLTYDLYAPLDTGRLRKLGTSLANEKGLPTSSIALVQTR